MPKLSVVSTLYHSAPYIEEFHSRLTKTIKELKLDKSYEIILVDDGSPDNACSVAKSLIEKDNNVQVIELSRNFGHHKAIMTGLAHAKGDYVFLIDIDLEEKPELLKDFWEELHKSEDTDIVYGIQETRKGNWFERISGHIFYKLFNWMCDQGYTEPNFSTVRLMTKGYVKALALYTEQEFYFSPISHLVGFNQKSFTIKKLSSSKSTYSFKRKYNMLINSIFSFSLKPLFFIFYFGLLTTLLSFLFALYIILNKLFFESSLSGWASIMVSIWFLGGIIILFLGIIAIYISKIFIETKPRPFSIIKTIHTKETN